MKQVWGLIFVAYVGLASTTARAEAGDLSLALDSEAVLFVGDSVGATSADSVGFTPGVIAGFAPIDRLTALLGWRRVIGLTRGGRGYDLTTSGDAVVAGARYLFGLHPIFDVGVQLELEALHTDFALDVAGHHGTDSSWGFGAVPKVLASASAPVGPFDFDFRLFAGFAARTDHRAVVSLSSDAPRSQVAPLDLGSVNLSGFVFGADFAIVF